MNKRGHLGLAPKPKMTNAHTPELLIQLVPLSGPPDWLLFGLFGWTFVFLPAMGALLPVTVHRLSRRAKIATVVGSIAVAAPVLWYELYQQGILDASSIWFPAMFLGAYVSEAITLVLRGSERGDSRFSIAGGGLGLVLIVGLLAL